MFLLPFICISHQAAASLATVSEWPVPPKRGRSPVAVKPRKSRGEGENRTEGSGGRWQTGRHTDRKWV